MSSINIPNSYPVELEAPDISAYAPGNTGVPYMWSWAAAAPGPHAMVTALVHGNELCGAIALDWLMRREVRPVRGRLSVGFLNVEAYARFDPADPNATRWVDEDMNRLWGADVLASARDSVEMHRVREVQPLVAEADLLLDIHSMQRPSPPMMMAGWCDKGVDLARKLGVPALIVKDRGHKAGMRMRDHGAFGEESAGAAAVLIECGQHWEAAAGDLAIESTARFLVASGVAAAELLDKVPDTRGPQEVWEVAEAVTIETDAFRFASAFTGGEVLAEAGTLIGYDGDRPVLTPHDNCLLVMPSQRLWPGQTAVRLAKRVTEG